MNKHFRGIIPDEKWKNDVLEELRMIRQLLERNAQVFEEEEEKPRRGRPRKDEAR